MDDALRARAEAVALDALDPDDAAEITSLIARGEEAELRSRMDPLSFGTAGLRGIMGGGPGRFGARVVALAAAALADALADQGAPQVMVMGHDARRRAAALADLAAEVVSGRGWQVLRVPGPCPTPLVAFAVRQLGAGGGVMITASHNPPEYGGLKAFGPHGGQIIPPLDAEVRLRMDSIGAARSLPRGARGQLRPDVEELYLDRAASCLDFADLRGTEIAYSPLQGVGASLFARLCARLGVTLHTVAAQAEPDGSFSATPEPNPERMEALAPTLNLARERGLDLALVHDPDADRLAVAATRDGLMTPLSGDQTGTILADLLLPEAGKGAHVATTLVSTRMVDRVAERHSADVIRTPTGFKWMAEQARRLEPALMALAFEEAIGFSVMDLVRDKDGLTAGLAVALAHARQPLWARWQALCARHGGYATGAFSFRYDSVKDAQVRFAGLSEQAPVLQGYRVARSESLPEHALVVHHLADGGWLAIRPSGTEPKLKVYFEARVPAGADAWVDAEAERDALGAVVREALGNQGPLGGSRSP